MHEVMSELLRQRGEFPDEGTLKHEAPDFPESMVYSAAKIRMGP